MICVHRFASGGTTQLAKAAAQATAYGFSYAEPEP